jgi:tetratricopeptide (TPR) repeat protein
LKKTIRRILLVSGCLFALVCMAAQTPDPNKILARETMNNGVAAFKSGDAKMAAEAFTRALQLDPDLTAAELYLGMTYASLVTPQNTEMRPKAIESFERVLQKEPNNTDAASRLAGLYLGSGDAAKARVLFLALTKSWPQDPAAFYSLGATTWMLVFNKTNPLPEGERRILIDEGLQSLDVALHLNPQHNDATIYKNLLLRQKAEIAANATERAWLLSEADELFNKALAARAQNGAIGTTPATGAGVAAPPPPPALPSSPAVPQDAIRVGSDAAQRNLDQKVEPLYPALARAARVQGTVLLQTSIDKTGQVVGVGSSQDTRCSLRLPFKPYSSGNTDRSC